MILVVAGAGFGKSTLLARSATGHPTAWYTIDDSDRSPTALGAGILEALTACLPMITSHARDLAGTGTQDEAGRDPLDRGRAVAELIADALEAALGPAPGELLLVLDDLHQLADAPGAWATVDTLVALAPPALRIVLSSRADPPLRLQRLRGQGLVGELTAPDLAFDPDEIAGLLEVRLPSVTASGVAELATRIHGLTNGWPAASRLAVEALDAAPEADRSALIARVAASSEAMFDYLAEEVLAGAPTGVRELIRLGSEFDRLSAGLATAIGVPDAAATLAGLARRALFVTDLAGEAGWYRLHDLARAYARSRIPLDAESRRAVLSAAAEWFEASGLAEDALRARIALADRASMERLIAAHAFSLTRGGAAGLVRDAAGAIPGPDRSAAIELALGEARLVLGEFRDAARSFVEALARVDRGTPEGRALVVALTWRLAVVAGFRGDWAEEVRIIEGVDPADGNPVDGAAVLAWRSAGLRRIGRLEEALAVGEAAVAAAEAAGDARIEAGAHASLGQALQAIGQPGPADGALDRAVGAADRAGDVIQLIRALVARGTLRIDLGRLSDAEADLDTAARLSEAIGFLAFQARAVAERGRARGQLGRLEEALADFAASRALYLRIDATAVVTPELSAGELFLERGEIAQARSALERGIVAARSGGDQLLLAIGLGLLAQAISIEDPGAARRLLDEAEPLGRAMASYTTLCCASLVHHELGEFEAAGELAAEAERIARERQQPLGLARSLELRALSASPSGVTGGARPVLKVEPAVRTQAIRWIEEAAAIWRSVGAPLALARNRLDLAFVAEGEVARAAAIEAERALRDLGGHQLAGEARARLAELDRDAIPAVAIRTLGGFMVARHGVPVPAAEWRSKKARDLLKILAARGRRPIAREALAELLWPEEDPEPLANRLSVALSTTRSVLDPERAFPTDWFVSGDRTSIRLDVDHLEVDVLRFLAEVRTGRTALSAGDREVGLARLEAAEALYAGAFCEEDPYEDWAVATREEAQAAYLDTIRTLADAARLSRPEAAARHELRVLELDPFDEGAHLGLIGALVASGRHGEARRRHGVYAARMAEIGVDVVPLAEIPTG